MSDSQIKEIQDKTGSIFKKYGLKYAGLFGSHARGDNREDSDIDILYKTNKPISIFEIMDMKDDLHKTLHKEVDLVSEDAVVPYFKDYIYKDLKQIYGER